MEVILRTYKFDYKEIIYGNIEIEALNGKEAEEKLRVLCPKRS